MSHSLEAYHHQQLIFRSTKTWLHPLFDLEQMIHTSAVNPAELDVYDKIVGAASAFLIVFLGIKTLHAGTLSHRGETVLQRFKIAFTSDTRVDRISCATEALLDPGMEISDAIAILRQRATAR